MRERFKFCFLLMLLALLGCSKSEPVSDSRSSGASSSAPPAAPVSRPQVTIVELAEHKEQKQLGNQALALLRKADYEGLEALAEKYRTSKESYADGLWKLAMVYSGLEPPDDAPATEWQERMKLVQEWSKARQESATARIAMARLLIGYARKARGTDAASAVKEKDWVLFSDRLQEALKSLKEAKRLKSNCPVYWSSLQRIALGMQLERGQYDAIFNQAIQEHPGYDYYSARAVFLLPRWYGEEGEWEKDLRKSADRVGGEAGDILYAQVIWSLDGIVPTDVGKAFNADKSVWDRVERGFNGILKKYPDSQSAIAERALLAGEAGDKAKARKYFLEIKEGVEEKQWGGKEQLERFLDWAFR